MYISYSQKPGHTVLLSDIFQHGNSMYLMESVSEIIVRYLSYWQRNLFIFEHVIFLWCYQISILFLLFSQFGLSPVALVLFFLCVFLVLVPLSISCIPSLSLHQSPCPLSFVRSPFSLYHLSCFPRDSRTWERGAENAVMNKK